MDSPDKNRLREVLDSACDCAEEGRCDEALRTIRTELERNKRSVYLLALEHQVEQLKEFSRNEPETEMQRLDILDSLPGLIEKAAEHPGLTVDHHTSPPAGHPDEQEAARRWLTSQYLQHAYRYLLQQHYTRALTELRRVYIVDPTNTLAKTLEERIDGLLGKQGEEQSD